MSVGARPPDKVFHSGSVGSLLAVGLPQVYTVVRQLSVGERPPDRVLLCKR